MSYPTFDSNHVKEALAFLTDHYKGKINLSNLISCYVQQIQVLEGVFWDLINKFLLSGNPTGDQLNAIGSIVGAQRGALSDADYLRAIVIQIRVNRSQGLSEDIIQIATLALGGASLPKYLDNGYGNMFFVECWNLLSPLVVASLLSKARSVATYGNLHYTTWADGNDFEFNSVSDTGAGEGTWGSVSSPTTGGLCVAGAAI